MAFWMQAKMPIWETFSNFSYINQKEYLDCISSVKREATGEIRLNPAIEWMSQGKPKNWKYM